MTVFEVGVNVHVVKPTKINTNDKYNTRPYYKLLLVSVLSVYSHVSKYKTTVSILITSKLF